MNSEIQVFIPLRKYRAGDGPSMEDYRIIVGADTLFGAICWSIRSLYGEARLREVLDKFVRKEPPFLVSSMYPAKLDDGVFMLLPLPKAPQIKSRLIRELEPRGVSRKLVERVVLVTVNGLKAILEKNYENLYIDTRGLPILSIKEESDRLFKITSASIYRNVLDRVSLSSDLFRSSFVEMEKSCGLAFYVIVKDESLIDELLSSLRFLPYMGIGGERSIGLGLGENDAIIKEEAVVNFGSGKYLMGLSPYSPDEDELIQLSNSSLVSYYSLEVRTAYYPAVGRIRYFVMGEGSVIPRLDGKDILGRMVEVGGGIYRYGLGFFIPIEVNEDE